MRGGSDRVFGMRWVATRSLSRTNGTACADDVRLLTQRYTAAIEKVVRRTPEQYLWLHRRWKHQPKPRGKAGKAVRIDEANG